LLGIGLGGMIRAISNIETAKLFELILHPKIQLNNSIEINSPVEIVFDYWRKFENFSQFMSYVALLHRLGADLEKI
jgi:uncharacterized membrane protein